MKLIADCGSTKIDWCLVNGQTTVKQFFSNGMNAVMLTEEEMASRFADELKPEVSEYVIDEIYFYGAGCISDEVCDNVRKAISTAVPTATKIEVHTDLLAAARALCGSDRGIACILGTGSNSCLYDGEKIAENVSPLGYILGDEGSGAVLGKLLVGDILKNQLPKDLCDKFLEQFSLDRLTIIRRVYKEPGGNRFLASLSPFLNQNIERAEIKALVINAFRAFFRRNIANYDGYRNMPVNFIGSIAHYYQPYLREAAELEGCKIGTILKSPMEGLLKFHC